MCYLFLKIMFDPVQTSQDPHNDPSRPPLTPPGPFLPPLIKFVPVQAGFVLVCLSVTFFKNHVLLCSDPQDHSMNPYDL